MVREQGDLAISYRSCLVLRSKRRVPLPWRDFDEGDQSCYKATCTCGLASIQYLRAGPGEADLDAMRGKDADHIRNRKEMGKIVMSFQPTWTATLISERPNSSK